MRSRSDEDGTRVPSLLVFVGPYAVGKDTVINSLLDRFGADLHRVTTLTTRPVSSVHDPSYTHISRSQYEELKASRGYIWNTQLSGATIYGTNLNEVRAAIEAGSVCIHAIYPGPHGAGALKEAFGASMYCVALVPPGRGRSEQLGELTARITARSRDSREALLARIAHQSDALDYIELNPVVHTPDGDAAVVDAVLPSDDLTELVETAILQVEKVFLLGGRTNAEIKASAVSRPHVGFSYFKPVERLINEGRHLSVPSPSQALLDSAHDLSRTWAALRDAIEPGEYVFGVYRRRLFRELVEQAPLLTDEEGLWEFESQVSQHAVERLGFISASTQLAEEGVSEGTLG